jgi:hypothetical protein
MDIPDYGPMFQAEADRLMANLTEEELRDGLFLEPQLKIVDGKVVGKMGIPDIFTQDKSPIEPRSTLFDDPFEEFDPDNPYREPDRGDNFIWQDNFGDYHQSWDDMGLETYIPGSYDEDFMSGKSATEAQEEFYNSQQVENEKAAEATRLRDIKARADIEKEIKDQMEARDAVLAAQAAEQTRLYELAKAREMKELEEKVAAIKAAQEEERLKQLYLSAERYVEPDPDPSPTPPPAYTPPVYTPPVQSSMGSGSNWKPSWTGGF